MAYGTKIIEKGSSFLWKFRLSRDADDHYNTAFFIGIFPVNKEMPTQGIKSEHYLYTWRGSCGDRNALIKTLPHSGSRKEIEMYLDFEIGNDEFDLERIDLKQLCPLCEANEA